MRESKKLSSDLKGEMGKGLNYSLRNMKIH